MPRCVPLNLNLILGRDTLLMLLSQRQAEAGVDILVADRVGLIAKVLGRT